jgi:hypothetical protein
VNGFSFPHTSSLNNTCKTASKRLLIRLILSTVLATAYLVILNMGIHSLLHGNSCYRITIKYDPGDRIIATAIMTNASRRNLHLNAVVWYSSHIKIFYSLSNERREKTAMSTLDLGSL